jgi:hypothetical protein
VCKYVDAVHIGALHKDVDFRLHCAHKKCCQNCKIVSALLCFHKNTDLDWQMCRSCAGAWISERRKGMQNVGTENPTYVNLDSLRLKKRLLAGI